MRLIIGLGNPESKYLNTRHNVGYLLVNKMWQRGQSSLISQKSNVYMNDSGTVVKKLVDEYSLNLNNLYIAYDDLDIKLGEYKIQFGVGPKDHKGLNSIYETLSTKDFWHIRIGIDNRPARRDTKFQAGEQYVLQDFTSEEKKIIDKVTNEICKKLATL